MVWLLLSILSADLAYGGLQSHFSGSSLPEVVRKAAAVAPRFLDAKLPFPAFIKLEQVIEEDEEGRGQAILPLLRLIGVDSTKIKALAFDGLLSVLHLMSQVLVRDGAKGRTGRRAPRNFPWFRFILRQPQVVDLLKDMENPRLVEFLLKESEAKLPQDKMDCVRLLLCKTKPFVRGMQRSLRFFMRRENVTVSGGRRAETPREEACREGNEDALWEKASLEARMYFFVPGLEEVTEEGDKCDQIFPNCVY